MSLKEYLGRFIKNRQEIEITYNNTYNDCDVSVVLSKIIRTGLYGKLLDLDSLEGIEYREIYCVMAIDNKLLIFLGNKESNEDSI